MPTTDTKLRLVERLYTEVESAHSIREDEAIQQYGDAVSHLVSCGVCEVFSHLDGHYRVGLTARSLDDGTVFRDAVGY